MSNRGEDDEVKVSASILMEVETFRKHGKIDIYCFNEYLLVFLVVVYLYLCALLNYYMYCTESS